MIKRFSKSKGPSQRQLRAGELIRHALVDIIQREPFHDPALTGVPITVTEVRVSPDLKQANVFAVPLGGENQQEVVDALNKVAPLLRGLLGKEIELKFTPQLKFLSDETFTEAQKIEDLLSRPEVARDLSKE